MGPVAAMTQFGDIVIFTHHYPWWCGPTAESYLEEEVRLLSAQARRIWIITTECWNDRPHVQLRHDIPTNVTALYLTMDDWDICRVRGRRFSQLKLLLSEEMRFETQFITSRARFAAFYRFIQQSDALFQKALDFIVGEDDSFFQRGSEPLLVYSFWFNQPARSAVLFAEYARARGRIFTSAICRAHGYDCYAYRNDLNYLPCQKWLVKKLDYVFPCSENGRQYISTRNKIDSSTLRTLHLGTVDYGLCPPKEQGSNEFHIVSCSRAVPLKRLDRIATSIAACRSLPRVRWTCIGDGETLESVKQLVSALGISDSVFFAGALSQEEVFSFYRCNHVDLFVNVSEAEGIPISIMEALSFGIPCVATRVGGNPEIVHHGENGFLIDKDFEDGELSALIDHVVNSNGLVLGKAARVSWEKEFSIEKNVLKMLGLVSETIQ